MRYPASEKLAIILIVEQLHFQECSGSDAAASGT